ncbi:MAG: hypothetical protein ACD_49C00023G0013 [uncultured bacterium (gcode 4)]|uniref:Serine hydrolase family protein n=1 Tax=uncultured bacterium (gcode 4) TaxID=1234023 RepID=K2AFD6_9BACT|nr:MAG: hypothetical protein ACD_49C00023G0013 [uncultured bacterium (gcode 4)]
MKTAIIIHGMPSKKDYFNPKWDSESNCHWLPWLQKQLIVNNILAQTPEMPEPFLPQYNEWKKEFERFDINENTILVGHSLWAGFIVRWLSESDVKVGKVVLVAPWINVNKEEDINFFDFEIDKNLNLKSTKLKVFASSNDDNAIKNSVDKLKNEILNLDIKNFENMGHFCFRDMNTREFPELLEFLIN